MAEEQAPRRSFHGRRKGKRLRDAQSERLERIHPLLRIEMPDEGEYLDPRRLFAIEPDRIVLEIGFGGGEHLAFRAREARNTGFLGVEPFLNGMAKLFAVIDAAGLENVRIFDDDAAFLLSSLEAGSIDLAYLLFPDPWPKRRQRKRRFLDDTNLASIARVLRPGGELRFATDIDDYVGWTLTRVAASAEFSWDPTDADSWRLPWSGWPGTRYEAKAKREGRASAYLTFNRV